ncbi:MAG: phenylalanine--tRNA ligase subunit alpha [Candidatus Nanopelagicales bacterium]|jgi:phenylalanyl-tRNA synthetase alpha chain
MSVDQSNSIPNLEQLAADFESAKGAIACAASLEEMKQVKSLHLGDRSPLALANRILGKLPVEDRAKYGAALGEYRKALNELFSAKELELSDQFENLKLQEERVDLSLAAVNVSRGGIHPLTATMNRVIEIFTAMGYSIEEGPEAESALLNFDALNIPPNHPARSMQDTFYIEHEDSGVVLRTQTSPVQIRSLINRDLPIYVISPGKVFRSDELDQTHTPVFHQVEGLVVDKGIGMPHLKATIDHFAKQMFGENVKTRLRPSYFPFTEPSAEMDVFFNGKWIEWGGCGVVNPKVLAAVGIDSNEYSGFAFGMGIERTLMFRNGVSDMRDMVEADIRFTQMFGAIN